MDDEEDEIDILGDFDLEDLLTRRDRTQASYSLSSNDNYSLPSSDWILENASPLFNVKSVLTSDQVIYDNPFPSTECLEVNPNIWTEKERTLLDSGLELFGKSHTRLSQYIGTKNPMQVKNYLKTYPLPSLASASSSNSINVGENELDTVEVVVSSADASSPAYSVSTLSDDYLDSYGSDTDSYMGSTTSSASESDKPLSAQQEISMQQLYQESKAEKVKSPPPKTKKHYIKKKPKTPPPPDEDSNDSVDYDNTNIIFKPRKLSKYHLMVKSGDRVLPTGEQVIRIKKGDAKSETDVDVLESDDDLSLQIPKTKPQRFDIDSFNPNRGIKISRTVRPKQKVAQLKGKKRININIGRNNPNLASSEDANEDIEVDVVDDLMDENIASFISSIPSCMPIPDEESDDNKHKIRSKKSLANKRSSSTKYEKLKKKLKTVSGRSSTTKNVNKNSNMLSVSPQNNVYLNKPNLNSTNKLVNSNKNITILESTSSQENCKLDSKRTVNKNELKLNSKKTIVFKESNFSSERQKLIDVDDLLTNYDFSNVRLIDHNTQMMRISQLRPIVPPGDEKTNSKLISVEEIDYHRDFFLHNDVFFVNRFLRIRNYILREWSCKKPKYITKTAIRCGLKHCGTMVLISRIHSYLQQKGFINT